MRITLGLVMCQYGHAPVLDNPSRERGLALAPMQTVLVAPGACSGIDVVDIQEKGRQPLDRLKTGVAGM